MENNPSDSLPPSCTYLDSRFTDPSLISPCVQKKDRQKEEVSRERLLGRRVRILSDGKCVLYQKYSETDYYEIFKIIVLYKEMG